MMMQSIPFPNVLREFVDSLQWTYAKTMPDWSHEYIVREKVDKAIFIQLVIHIRTNGYVGKFFQQDITYYDENGMVYWTMGAPLEETTIINRCKEEYSYKYRLEHSLLP